MKLSFVAVVQEDGTQTLSINGMPDQNFTSSKELTNYIKENYPGNEIILTVCYGNQAQNLKLNT